MNENRQLLVKEWGNHLRFWNKYHEGTLEEFIVSHIISRENQLLEKIGKPINTAKECFSRWEKGNLCSLKDVEDLRNKVFWLCRSIDEALAIIEKESKQ